MKTVLAFGDSLTWGSRPDGGGRHRFEDRWPNVLQAGLDGVDVVTDGLRGRTTAMDQHASPGNMNGAALLPSALHTHAPLDVVIVFLGTNDVYWGYAMRRAVRGIEHLIEQIRIHPARVEGAPAPKPLVVIPPQLVACAASDVDETLIAKSALFADKTTELCKRLDVAHFDAGSVAQSSPLDGVHLEADQTRAIGKALIPIVQALLT